MHLLKPYKMKIKFVNLLMAIYLGFSATAQIDNGTNYIPDSRNSELKAESLCDQLITKDGKIVSVLVKEVNPNLVKYKMCRDYGTNASVSGSLILIEKSKIQKIIFADGRIIEFNSPKKTLKRLTSSVDNSLSQTKKNILSFSAGMGYHNTYLSSQDAFFSNYYIDDLRYNSASSYYYQLKYLRSLTANSLINLQVGLSLDFFDLPDYLEWTVYNFDGTVYTYDYGFLDPYNATTINLEMESTFFNTKRIQYFAGFGFGYCLNNDDRFQLRFTNGLSLLSKNKVHCFSLKSSGLINWFYRESIQLSSVYNNSTGYYDFLSFTASDYSSGYTLGIEFQYGFKF